MNAAIPPDVARLICGNIEDLRCSLSAGTAPDRSLLQRCLAACTGNEQKTKRTMIERALRKLDAAPATQGGKLNPVVPNHGTSETARAIIDELRDTFELGERPSGIAAAVILNDLKAVVAESIPFMEWVDVCEAVRFVHTHVPVGKVQEWRKKLQKGVRK